MHREVLRTLQLGTSLLVLLGYLALASTDHYGSTILFLPLTAILLMPIGESLDRRYPAYRQLTASVTLVYALSLPILLKVFDLLTAVTSLVVYVQLYSMLHEKKERNYDHILLMSFFLLLSAAVQSPTPSIAVVFALFVPTAVWVLVMLEIHATAGKSSAPDSIEILGPKTKKSLPEEVKGRLLDARLVGWISACSLALLAMTGMFFLVTPRMEAGLLGASDPDRFVTGLAPEVDLASGGVIEQDATTVMHAVFPQEDGGQYRGEMFWRSTSLDQYTGSGWVRRGLITNIPVSTPREAYRRYSNNQGWSGGEAVDRQGHGRGRLVLQEVFMAQPPEEGVPCLSLVKAMMPSEGQKHISLRWDPAGDFTVALASKRVQGFQYRAWSEVFRPKPGELRASSEDYLSIITPRDHRLLVRHNLLPETQELVRRVTQDADTAYDKVMAIEHWLSSAEFTYSLTVPELPENQPIDAFIHDTRTGHCDLFASAMALSIRSLGIPARVVRGYRGGDWNPSDLSYTITASMAHLWVEVFFPDFGWITFDPSPPADEDYQYALGAVRRRVSFLTMKLKMFWYRQVVGFDPVDRFRAVRDSSLEIFRANQGGEEKDVDGAEHGYASGLFQRILTRGAVLAVVLSLAFPAIRAYRRRRAPDRALSDDQARAVRLYRLLSRRMIRLGYECAGKTVEELREEIAGALEPALTVLSAYNAVRFGERPLPPESFAALRGLIRSLPKALP